MKKIINWLVNSLSLTFSSMLMFSSPLPGTADSISAKFDPPQKSYLQQLESALDTAELNIIKNNRIKAESHLREADSLAEQIQSHSLEFTSLSQRKTELWEDFQSRWPKP